MKIKKLYTLFLLLPFTATVFSQTNNESSTISETEKKQLENKFKALSDFYIDDSGLVVYRGASTSSTSTQSSTDSGSDKPQNNVNAAANSNNVRVVSESEPQPYIINKEPEVKKTPTSDPATPQPPVKKYSPSTVRQETVVVSKEPINTSNREVIVVEKTENVGKQITKNTVSEDLGQTSLAEENRNVTVTKSNKKGSVFDRSKRKSEYKNMEEAALAVEALLEELKKEQVTLKGSGSMSARLSKGVTKDLRKSSNTPGVAKEVRSPYETIDPNVSVKSSQVTQVEHEYGDEPCYFINGVQVDKVEVNKLTRNEIINREIRIRNTVTNNPNGEIWYTVKYKTE